MALEGVIAGLFFDLLTSRAIVAPFEKCCEVLALDRPSSFPEFVRGFLRRFPEDRRIVCRILLENTHGAIMDRDVGGLYRTAYWARKALQQHRGTRETKALAERTYRRYLEQLVARAVSGEDLFANVGAPVWFGSWNRSIDLNSANQQQLLEFGIQEKVVTRLLAERARRGFFTGNAHALIESFSK